MDENMRRLPPWMLAGASSGVTDNKSADGKRKHEPEIPKTKAEKRPRRTVKHKERDDSEESKKVGIRKRGERVRSKIGEEEAKPRIGDGKNPDDEDLTVDDLLSFAQEYVKGEEDRTRKERESWSVSESMGVVDESSSHTTSPSERGTEEPNETRDPGTEDMLQLLLGPFYKKPQQ